MTQPEKKKRDGATPFDQVDLQLPVETIHLKFVPWNFEARFKKWRVCINDGGWCHGTNLDTVHIFFHRYLHPFVANK
jgi:hypothetical protein